MATAQPDTRRIRLAELSLATDLAMNFPPETALRTCLLALKIGQDIGLSENQLSEVFYVSLLRHIGCTAFSHEEGITVGDDNAFRSHFTGIDSRRATHVAGAFFRIGRGPVGGMRVLSAFARSSGPVRVRS